MEPWTCPTCKAGVATRFCPTCGEHPLRPGDLTLRGFLGHVFEAFTSIDSRLVRSLRYLVSRPGVLTVAYLQGRRKPFIGPVPLFLIANVLFFAVESMTGGTIFTTPLHSHLHTQPWSGFVPGLVENRLSETGTTLELYTPIFDRAIALKARALIIFMAIAFAPLPLLVFRRQRLPAIAHAVFSLHVYAYLLLLFCVAAVIPPVNAWFGGAGHASESLDHGIAISLLVAAAVYLYFAIATTYGSRGILRVVSTLVLTAGVIFIVLGYRFVLLPITLYTT